MVTYNVFMHKTSKYTFCTFAIAKCAYESYWYCAIYKAIDA